jgi:hypothetical protein
MECRDIWLKRFTRTSPPAYRALRRRIKLRGELGREPSATEILQSLPNYDLSYKDVSAAFKAKEEVRLDSRFLAVVANASDTSRPCALIVSDA